MHDESWCGLSYIKSDIFTVKGFGCYGWKLKCLLKLSICDIIVPPSRTQRFWLLNTIYNLICISSVLLLWSIKLEYIIMYFFVKKIGILVSLGHLHFNDSSNPSHDSMLLHPKLCHSFWSLIILTLSYSRFSGR